MGHHNIADIFVGYLNAIGVTSGAGSKQDETAVIRLVTPFTAYWGLFERSAFHQGIEGDNAHLIEAGQTVFVL